MQPTKSTPMVKRSVKLGSKEYDSISNAIMAIFDESGTDAFSDAEIASSLNCHNTYITKIKRKWLKKNQPKSQETKTDKKEKTNHKHVSKNFKKSIDLGRPKSKEDWDVFLLESNKEARYISNTGGGGYPPYKLILARRLLEVNMKPQSIKNHCGLSDLTIERAQKTIELGKTYIKGLYQSNEIDPGIKRDPDLKKENSNDHSPKPKHNHAPKPKTSQLVNKNDKIKSKIPSAFENVKIALNIAESAGKNVKSMKINTDGSISFDF